jgi:FkbM family methyltransferase
MDGKSVTNHKRFKDLTITLQSPGSKSDFRFVLDTSKFSQNLMWKCFADGRMYEPETTRFLAGILTQGDTFIDIGAHIGYFSCVAAKLVGNHGKIFCFEPETSNYQHLLQHISLNNLQNVLPFKLAVGDRNGTVSLYVNQDNDGGHALWDVRSHFFNVESRNHLKTDRVPQATLETALSQMSLNSLKAIKIDTEGSEYNIIHGGLGLLRKHDVPYVLCEVNRFGLQQMGTSETALRQLMSQLGYSSFLLTQNPPFSMKLLPSDVVNSQSVFNLLFARASDLPGGTGRVPVDRTPP